MRKLVTVLAFPWLTLSIMSCGKDYSAYSPEASDSLAYGLLDASAVQIARIYELAEASWPTASELNTAKSACTLKTGDPALAQILDSLGSANSSDCKVAANDYDYAIVVVFELNDGLRAYVRVLGFEECSFVQPLPGVSEFGVHGVWTRSTGALIEAYLQAERQ